MEKNRRAVPIESIALKGLFLLAIAYTIYFARDILLPLTLALLLNFLLSPIIRGLKKIRIPEPASAGLVMLALLTCVIYGTITLSRPAVDWIKKAPGSLKQLEEKAGLLRTRIGELNRSVEGLKNVTRVEGEQKPQVEVQGPSTAGQVLSGTREILAKGAIMFILLYFLLASGDLFLRKSVKVSPGLQGKKQVVEIIRTIEQNVSRYLYTVTLINFLEGLCIALGMYLIGMPDPVLWGVMAAFLIYLPYIGPLFGIFIVTIVALFTFDSVGRALLAPGLYFVLEGLQGYVITPMVLGYRFEINPAVILIWLIIWGWMWGVVGALLAFPMLTVFKILCDHIDELSPIGEFLGNKCG